MLYSPQLPEVAITVVQNKEHKGVGRRLEGNELQPKNHDHFNAAVSTSWATGSCQEDHGGSVIAAPVVKLGLRRPWITVMFESMFVGCGRCWIREREGRSWLVVRSKNVKETRCM